MRRSLSAFSRSKTPVDAVTVDRKRSVRPCTLRDVMRAEDQGRKPVPINDSKTARRKRRLARGIRRWDHDRRLCAEPTRRIARGTLTLATDDFEAAYGRVRDFWAKVRKRWLGTRYFCWLELTRKGRVHYHWVWLNPPPRWEIDLQWWVAKQWGARTQVRFSQYRDRALQDELEYALGYAKKLGRKSYQQRYEVVPRQLRTFMSQRLEIPGGVIDEHLDRDVYEYVPADVVAGQLVDEHLRFVRHLQHEWGEAGYCTAVESRRPRLRPRARAPGAADRR